MAGNKSFRSADAPQNRDEDWTWSEVANRYWGGISTSVSMVVSDCKQSLSELFTRPKAAPFYIDKTDFTRVAPKSFEVIFQEAFRAHPLTDPSTDNCHRFFQQLSKNAFEYGYGIDEIRQAISNISARLDPNDRVHCRLYVELTTQFAQLKTQCPEQPESITAQERYESLNAAILERLMTKSHATLFGLSDGYQPIHLMGITRESVLDYISTHLPDVSFLLDGSLEALLSANIRQLEPEQLIHLYEGLAKAIDTASGKLDKHFSFKYQHSTEYKEVINRLAGLKQTLFEASTTLEKTLPEPETAEPFNIWNYLPSKKAAAKAVESALTVCHKAADALAEPGAAKRVRSTLLKTGRIGFEFARSRAGKGFILALYASAQLPAAAAQSMTYNGSTAVATTWHQAAHTDFSGLASAELMRNLMPSGVTQTYTGPQVWGRHAPVTAAHRRLEEIILESHPYFETQFFRANLTTETHWSISQDQFLHPWINHRASPTGFWGSDGLATKTTFDPALAVFGSAGDWVTVGYDAPPGPGLIWEGTPPQDMRFGETLISERRAVIWQDSDTGFETPDFRRLHKGVVDLYRFDTPPTNATGVLTLVGEDGSLRAFPFTGFDAEGDTLRYECHFPDGSDLPLIFTCAPDNIQVTVPYGPRDVGTYQIRYHVYSVDFHNLATQAYDGSETINEAEAFFEGEIVLPGEPIQTGIEPDQFHQATTTEDTQLSIPSTAICNTPDGSGIAVSSAVVLSSTDFSAAPGSGTGTDPSTAVTYDAPGQRLLFPKSQLDIGSTYRVTVTCNAVRGGKCDELPYCTPLPPSSVDIRELFFTRINSNPTGSGGSTHITNVGGSAAEASAVFTDTDTTHVPTLTFQYEYDNSNPAPIDGGTYAAGMELPVDHAAVYWSEVPVDTTPGTYIIRMRAVDELGAPSNWVETRFIVQATPHGVKAFLVSDIGTSSPEELAGATAVQPFEGGDVSGDNDYFGSRTTYTQPAWATSSYSNVTGTHSHAWTAPAGSANTYPVTYTVAVDGQTLTYTRYIHIVNSPVTVLPAASRTPFSTQKTNTAFCLPVAPEHDFQDPNGDAMAVTVDPALGMTYDPVTSELCTTGLPPGTHTSVIKGSDKPGPLGDPARYGEEVSTQKTVIVENDGPQKIRVEEIVEINAPTVGNDLTPVCVSDWFEHPQGVAMTFSGSFPNGYSIAEGSTFAGGVAGKWYLIGTTQTRTAGESIVAVSARDEYGSTATQLVDFTIARSAPSLSTDLSSVEASIDLSDPDPEISIVTTSSDPDLLGGVTVTVDANPNECIHRNTEVQASGAVTIDLKEGCQGAGQQLVIRAENSDGDTTTVTIDLDILFQDLEGHPQAPHHTVVDASTIIHSHQLCTSPDGTPISVTWSTNPDVAVPVTALDGQINLHVTPAALTQGTHAYNITCSTDNQPTDLVVNGLIVVDNHAPYFTVPILPDRSAMPGGDAVVVNAGTFGADEDRGDTLTYSYTQTVGTDISGSITFDEVTGALTLNTKKSDPPGVRTFQISAEDPHGAESVNTITVSINVESIAPETTQSSLTVIGGEVGVALDPICLSDYFNHPQGTAITDIQASGLLSGYRVVTGAEAPAGGDPAKFYLIGTSAAGPVQTTDARITATDANGKTTTMGLDLSFTESVPVLTQTATDVTAHVFESQTVALACTDPNDLRTTAINRVVNPDPTLEANEAAISHLSLTNVVTINPSEDSRIGMHVLTFQCTKLGSTPPLVAQTTISLTVPSRAIELIPILMGNSHLGELTVVQAADHCISPDGTPTQALYFFDPVWGRQVGTALEINAPVGSGFETQTVGFNLTCWNEYHTEPRWLSGLHNFPNQRPGWVRGVLTPVTATHGQTMVTSVLGEALDADGTTDFTFSALMNGGSPLESDIDFTNGILTRPIPRGKATGTQILKVTAYDPHGLATGTEAILSLTVTPSPVEKIPTVSTDLGTTQVHSDPLCRNLQFPFDSKNYATPLEASAALQPGVIESFSHADGKITAVYNAGIYRVCAQFTDGDTTSGSFSATWISGSQVFTATGTIRDPGPQRVEIGLIDGAQVAEPWAFDVRRLFTHIDAVLREIMTFTPLGSLPTGISMLNETHVGTASVAAGIQGLKQMTFEAAVSGRTTSGVVEVEFPFSEVTTAPIDPAALPEVAGLTVAEPPPGSPPELLACLEISVDPTRTDPPQINIPVTSDDGAPITIEFDGAVTPTIERLISISGTKLKFNTLEGDNGSITNQMVNFVARTGGSETHFSIEITVPDQATTFVDPGVQHIRAGETLEVPTGRTDPDSASSLTTVVDSTPAALAGHVTIVGDQVRISFPEDTQQLGLQEAISLRHKTAQNPAGIQQLITISVDDSAPVVGAAPAVSGTDATKTIIDAPTERRDPDGFPINPADIADPTNLADPSRAIWSAMTADGRAVDLNALCDVSNIQLSCDFPVGRYTVTFNARTAQSTTSREITVTITEGASIVIPTEPGFNWKNAEDWKKFLGDNWPKFTGVGVTLLAIAVAAKMMRTFFIYERSRRETRRKIGEFMEVIKMVSRFYRPKEPLAAPLPTLRQGLAIDGMSTPRATDTSRTARLASMRDRVPSSEPPSPEASGSAPPSPDSTALGSQPSVHSLDLQHRTFETPTDFVELSQYLARQIKNMTRRSQESTGLHFGQYEAHVLANPKGKATDHGVVELGVSTSQAIHSRTLTGTRPKKDKTPSKCARLFRTTRLPNFKWPVPSPTLLSLQSLYRRHIAMTFLVSLESGEKTFHTTSILKGSELKTKLKPQGVDNDLRNQMAANISRREERIGILAANAAFHSQRATPGWQPDRSKTRFQLDLEPNGTRSLLNEYAIALSSRMFTSMLYNDGKRGAVLAFMALGAYFLDSAKEALRFSPERWGIYALMCFSLRDAAKNDIQATRKVISILNQENQAHAWYRRWPGFRHAMSVPDFFVPYLESDTATGHINVFGLSTLVGIVMSAADHTEEALNHSLLETVKYLHQFADRPFALGEMQPKAVAQLVHQRIFESLAKLLAVLNDKPDPTAPAEQKADDGSGLESADSHKAKILRAIATCHNTFLKSKNVSLETKVYLMLTSVANHPNPLERERLMTLFIEQTSTKSNVLSKHFYQSTTQENWMIFFHYWVEMACTRSMLPEAAKLFYFEGIKSKVVVMMESDPKRFLDNAFMLLPKRKASQDELSRFTESGKQCFEEIVTVIFQNDHLFCPERAMQFYDGLFKQKLAPVAMEWPLEQLLTHLTVLRLHDPKWVMETIAHLARSEFTKSADKLIKACTEAPGTSVKYTKQIVQALMGYEISLTTHCLAKSTQHIVAFWKEDPNWTCDLILYMHQTKARQVHQRSFRGRRTSDSVGIGAGSVARVSPMIRPDLNINPVEQSLKSLFSSGTVPQKCILICSKFMAMEIKLPARCLSTLLPNALTVWQINPKWMLNTLIYLFNKHPNQVGISVLKALLSDGKTPGGKRRDSQLFAALLKAELNLDTLKNIYLAVSKHPGASCLNKSHIDRRASLVVNPLQAAWSQVEDVSGDLGRKTSKPKASKTKKKRRDPSAASPATSAAPPEALAAAPPGGNPMFAHKTQLAFKRAAKARAKAPAAARVTEGKGVPAPATATLTGFRSSQLRAPGRVTRGVADKKAVPGTVPASAPHQ